MVVIRMQISGQKMPKEKAPFKSLSIIMLDFVVKAKKRYYPQTLSEECKYENGKPYWRWFRKNLIWWVR